MDVMENKAIRFRKKILPNPLKAQWRNYFLLTGIEMTVYIIVVINIIFIHISQQSAKINNELLTTDVITYKMTEMEKCWTTAG